MIVPSPFVLPPPPGNVLRGSWVRSSNPVANTRCEHVDPVSASPPFHARRYVTGTYRPWRGFDGGFFLFLGAFALSLFSVCDPRIPGEGGGPRRLVSSLRRRRGSAGKHVPGGPSTDSAEASVSRETTVERNAQNRCLADDDG